MLGNSDAFLLDPDARAELTTDRQLTQREWSLSQLTTEDVEDLRAFEATVEVDLDGLRLLCFHASPTDYDTVVLPEDPPDAFAGTGADLLPFELEELAAATRASGLPLAEEVSSRYRRS